MAWSALLTVCIPSRRLGSTVHEPRELCLFFLVGAEELERGEAGGRCYGSVRASVRPNVGTSASGLGGCWGGAGGAPPAVQ